MRPDPRSPRRWKTVARYRVIAASLPFFLSSFGSFSSGDPATRWTVSRARRCQWHIVNVSRVEEDIIVELFRVFGTMATREFNSRWSVFFVLQLFKWWKFPKDHKKAALKIGNGLCNSFYTGVTKNWVTFCGQFFAIVLKYCLYKSRRWRIIIIIIVQFSFDTPP